MCAVLAPSLLRPEGSHHLVGPLGRALRRSPHTAPHHDVPHALRVGLPTDGRLYTAREWPQDLADPLPVVSAEP